MKFSTSILTYVALQTFTINSATAAAEAHENRFIVKFKDHGRFEAANMRHLQSNPKHIMALPDDDIEVMSLETEEEIRYWEQQDGVEYVEPDHKVYLLAESVPWGITATKALEVSDNPVSNQKVCIIDSGYDINHPDLPSSKSIVSGNSQIDSQSWTEDGIGHGTHVAGTIAAIGGNNEGVVGVNRNGQVKLHIVKAFDNSGAWTHTSNLIQAVESCAAAGSTVVNMSLGCNDCFSQSQNDAFTRIYNQGVLLVAAAGNSGNSAKRYPASYSSVMSVAAVDKNNNRAYFSQYNDAVDIAAPGVDIRSTFPGGGYKSWQGTSMASPHVAGVAALVWSHFPTKTAQEIRQALESTAIDLGSVEKDNEFGYGLVQADRAYSCLAEGNCSSGKSDKTCEDEVGWYDSGGPEYDCAAYAQENFCELYGDSYMNFGKTANQACCVCDGGTHIDSSTSSSPSASPTMISSQGQPTDSPTMSPTTISSNYSMLCGCESCSQDVFDRELSTVGTTVGDTIDWVASNLDYSEQEVCTLVCSILSSDICEECNPTTCTAAPTEKVKTIRKGRNNRKSKKSKK